MGLGVNDCGGTTIRKAAAARDMVVVDVIMGSAAGGCWVLGRWVLILWVSEAGG